MCVSYWQIWRGYEVVICEDNTIEQKQLAKCIKMWAVESEV